MPQSAVADIASLLAGRIAVGTRLVAGVARFACCPVPGAAASFLEGVLRFQIGWTQPEFPCDQWQRLVTWTCRTGKLLGRHPCGPDERQPELRESLSACSTALSLEGAEPMGVSHLIE